MGNSVYLIDSSRGILYNMNKHNRPSACAAAERNERMNRYVSDASRVRLAREIAGESIVLLKNEGALPLRREKPAAFFGKGQFELYIGGSGSGASSNKNAAILVPELKKRGQKLVDSLTSFYEAGFDPGKAERARQEMFKQFSGLVASGAIYEFFGKYTPPEEETAVPDELVAAAAKETDTAVLILGRRSEEHNV